MANPPSGGRPPPSSARPELQLQTGAGMRLEMSHQLVMTPKIRMRVDEDEVRRNIVLPSEDEDTDVD